MKFTGSVLFIYITAILLMPVRLSGQQNYYISSVNGNDANSGTSAGSAWRTLTKLQTVIPNLQPGSRINLERGSVWYGSHLNFNTVRGSSSSPIIITAYGTGAEPVLSGGILVGSFQQNGNLWTKTDAAFPPITEDMKIVAGLYINDHMYFTGRMPNSGYYTTSTSGTGTYLEDNDVSWSPNQWQGGQVVARTVSWAYDKSYITSSDVHSFNLEGLYYPFQKELTYYFLQNHVNALDINYEWAYNNQTLSVYSTSNLNQQKVELPVSEELVVLSNCEYIRFENLHFTKANLTGITIDRGTGIEIKYCKFSNIASAGVKASESRNLKFENCLVYDCFSNAIKLDSPGLTSIQNNQFKRIGIFPGASNGTIRVGSTITCYVAQETVTVQYNRFDSVMLGYQQHWSNCPMYFQYNIIEDYGMICGDIAAVYLEGESYGDHIKYVKNNIILNGHSDLESYYEWSTGAFPHGIYLDYDCVNVLADSNTIVNCNLAVLFNRVRRNTVQHTNIFNPGDYLVPDWKTAVMWDGNIGLFFETLDYNNFINNQVVFDNDPSVMGFILHNAPVLENTMDYNAYILPFRENSDIVKTVQDYSVFSLYNLSEWYSTSGQEEHSTYGNSSTHYNPGLGISQTEWVKVYYNPTRSTRYQPLGAKYVDKDGVVFDRGINIPPFYSKILFYHGTTDYPNQYPNLQAQSFYIEEQTPLPPFVGRVVASDPDPGQVLTYALTGGNTDNTFRIDPATGDLFLNVNYLDFYTIESFSLTVQVSDNGIPSLSRSATVTVYLTEDPVNYPPVIINQQFTVEYQNDLPDFIGQIVASDPNMGQTLTYSITSGNALGYFVLFSSNGNLYFESTFKEIPDGVYSLVIRVTDNGTPALYFEATITVTVIDNSINTPPLIENQNFRFIDEENTGVIIGTVIASDPDEDIVTYEILSGDEGVISINGTTGELVFFPDIPDFDSNREFDLIVQVTDNGSPVESKNAFVTVEIIVLSNVFYIDPSRNTQGSGTIDDPLNSVENINFEAEHIYLIKRNTVTTLNNTIDITSDNVIVSSYGEGEIPVVQSGSNDYLLRSVDHGNVSIEELHFRGNYALGCVYILGPSSENIAVRNCIFEGSDYGLRLVNTGSVLVEHSMFDGAGTGIFGITRDLRIHYNIFTNNETAINLPSVEGITHLYNNVFFGNALAIINNIADVNLYNNIFSLIDPSDRALVSDYMVDADHNLYYPVRNGFINIETIPYNSLEEIQEFFEIEMNSLTMDPKFTDPENMDFKLNTSSPAVDAGTYLGLIYDINGNPIPSGHAPDIGAIETIDDITSDENITVPGMDNFIIYPVPATDCIHISFLDPVSGTYRFEVFDITGKPVIIEEREITASIPEHLLTVGSLKEGVYFVRIVSNGQIYSGKFIKD